MDDDTNGIMAGLTQMEIDAIYRMQQRVYWEADFVDRCIERRVEEEVKGWQSISIGNR